MLSISLNPSLESFWENTIMPIISNTILASIGLQQVNDPGDGTVMANGGFILMNASSYRSIGGHKAVKDSSPEDVFLARLAKVNRVSYRFMYGRGLGSQRWYDSFRAIWRTWTRYYSINVGSDIPLSILIILLLFAIGILPFIVLISQSVALVSGRSFSHPVFWLALAQTSNILGYRLHRAVVRGLAKSYFLTHPLGTFILIMIIINSVILNLTGRAVIPKLIDPPDDGNKLELDA
jgi:hypothetical protein